MMNSIFNEAGFSQISNSHFQRTGNIESVALKYLRIKQLVISRASAKTTGFKSPGHYVK